VKKRDGFSGSVVSYPGRGPYGSSSYRGNTTGYIVADFLATYHRDRTATFCDPMQGGGTSGDVARAMGIPYLGLDLREGFDAARHDLLTKATAPIGSAFLHFAYMGMIGYSSRVWGDAAHPADISAVGEDVQAFLEMSQAVMQNVYRALRPGGYYAVLVGNWRKNGTYHHLPSRLLTLAPGTLTDEIIKVQHNCVSDRKAYSGEFVRIEHETMLVFRREADGSIFAMTAQTLATLQAFHAATWRSLVVGAVRGKDAFTLNDLYATFDGHARTGSNPNWRAKLRQVVQDTSAFERLGKGRYAFKADAHAAV
jgi:hypothetical protein